MSPAQQAISAFLSESASDAFLLSGSINDSIADRFIKLIRDREKRSDKVAIFLTTYGGDPDAAYRIARALRKNYKRVKILIPGVCKSAGTLVTLAADELSFSCFGEIGPLDTQINKPDELLSRHSGLDIIQSMDSITRGTFDCFETHMLKIIQASSGAISTKVASEIAIQLTTGMIAPITGQIDPVRLGSAQRAIDIARAYGKRLSTMSGNLKPDALDQLINSYPTHSFVIDHDEAKELFTRVDEFTENEENVYKLFEAFTRNPAPDGIVLDLEQFLPAKEGKENETSDGDTGTNSKSESTTTSEKPPPERQQRSNQSTTPRKASRSTAVQ